MQSGQGEPRTIPNLQNVMNRAEQGPGMEPTQTPQPTSVPQSPVARGPSQVSSSQPIPTDQRPTSQNNQTLPPTAREIKAAVDNENSALNSILGKVTGAVPQQEFDPQKVADAAKPKPAEPIPSAPAPEPQPIVEPPPAEEPTAPDNGEDAPPDTSEATNLKRMRHSLAEERGRIKVLEDERKAIAEKLEKYEKGEIVPDIMFEKEKEIERLRPLEKLHALKTSREYQEGLVKPLNELHQKLIGYAEDYGISPGLMRQALGITNRAELNRFLSNHFDEVGALEVKGLLDQTRTLETKMREAEVAPEQELQRLQAESVKILEAQKQERKSKIADKSRSAFISAQEKIQNEKRFLELIPIEGDPDHNEKVVTPLRKAAATEYGKIVAKLAEAGLETLPDDVAEALSTMCLYAHTASVATQTRNSAIAQLEELQQNGPSARKYSRPPVGMNMAPNAPTEPKPRAPSGPVQAADQILAKVMGRQQQRR